MECKGWIFLTKKYLLNTSMCENWKKNEKQALIICASYQKWVGTPLIPKLPNLAELLFFAPFVVVSHGTEPDPILNYGNQTALHLWEMTWEELTQMPSRLTAEEPNREERARLLKSVAEKGYIDDYQGVRITKTGKRFFIPKATVWNLEENGKYAGQAAMFREWKFL
jgi:hypothetical protein